MTFDFSLGPVDHNYKEEVLRAIKMRVAVGDLGAIIGYVELYGKCCERLARPAIQQRHHREPETIVALRANLSRLQEILEDVTKRLRKREESLKEARKEIKRLSPPRYIEECDKILANAPTIEKNPLKKNELFVLHARQSKTLKQIAKEMMVSSERVRQIESKASRKIRRALVTHHVSVRGGDFAGWFLYLFGANKKLASFLDFPFSDSAKKMLVLWGQINREHYCIGCSILHDDTANLMCASCRLKGKKLTIRATQFAENQSLYFAAREILNLLS